MTISVVVRSKDEADRLRLTLASLARQSETVEAIIVNDGSCDHTKDVIADAARRMPVMAIHHEVPYGRSAASNRGAAAATGDILLFLDGDTLAGPDLAVRHSQAHRQTPNLCGRGETFHVRSTRFLRDPQTASPGPGQEARLDRLPAHERERLKVTLKQVEDDFADIQRRAAPGVYPGAGPRLLYDLETSALQEHPECSVLWAASAGSNFSMRRDAFAAAGGFDAALDNNEHRELALRLVRNGGRMGFVKGAFTYHLTHRIGWRDPLKDSDWERVFYHRHPILAVKLLSVFWASIADNSQIPREARIHSLMDLEQACRNEQNVDFDAVRKLIPSLPILADPQARPPSAP